MGKQKLYLLGFLLFLQSVGFSQNARKIDSLRTALFTSDNDSISYVLTSQLIREFRFLDIDSSVKYLNYAEGVAMSMQDTQKLGKVYRGYGILKKQVSQYNEATACFEESAKYFKLINDTLNLGLVYVKAAHNQLYKTEYEQGLLYCDTARSYLELMGEKEIINLGSVSEMEGLIYRKIGNLPKSMEHMQSALSVWEKADFKRGMASITNNIGLIYLEMEEDSLAADYFYRFRELSEELNEKEFLSTAYSNLGVVYLNLGEDSLALDNYMRALELYKNIGDPERTGMVLNNIGVYFMDRGEYEQSNHYLFQGIDELQNTDAVENKIFIYHNLGSNYLSLEKPELAKKYIQMNYDLAESSGSLSQKSEAASLMTAYAESINDFENAFKYHRQYTEYKDSLFNENSIRETENIRYQFALEKEEAKTEILRQEKLAQTNKLEKQQVIIVAIISGLVFTFIFIFYLGRMLRFRKKAMLRLKQQAEDLRIARDKAEAASKAKAEFLSVMSHEIRTPMNAVIGMTHLLLDEKPRADQVDYLNTLKFSGTNLLSLINDILDFSKIESGKLTLEQIDFNLQEMVRGITQAIGIKGQDKGIEVKYNYDSELNPMYIGDPVRLGQVLTNLMGNAIKFTEEGMVELNVRKMGDGKILFAVKDTGIGIPEDKQSLIFEQFSQSSSDTTRKYGGTGLGLAITKRLLNLMDTDIALESTPGVGSTFYFYLDMEESTESADATDHEDINGRTAIKSLKGVKILVAEDNPVNQIIATKFLEKWDIELKIAGDGQEAFELVQVEEYDMILMDIHMPEVDGIQATQLIRNLENPELANIPIIALTASALEEEVRDILEAGMNDVITKPFDPAVLYQKIAKYSEKEQSHVVS